MGRKKIAKEPKNTKGKRKDKEEEQDHSEEEIVPEPTPVKKKGGKSAKVAQPTSELNIFSDSFKNRISEFTTFYKEFLERKAASEDVESSNELDRVTKKVSEEIEVACSKVLKHELNDIQQWIKDQQKTIQEQIEKISKAYDENKKTLSETKTFNESEIAQQLKPIESKKGELQESHDNYGQLLKRAEQIYNVDGMDVQ